MSQMTLWNAESLGIVDNLKTVTVIKPSKNKEGVLTAETLKLLPMTSKDGDSIKSMTGFTGAQLKAHARESADNLKKVLVHQAVAIGGNSQFTGVAMRVSKSGRVSMTFKRVQALRLEDYTTEELQAMINQRKADAATAAQAELPTGNGNGKTRKTRKPKTAKVAA